ncbi:hypothetical protein [Desulfosporosinus youngiae]|uniref:Uncharacterized protein n=1 Tax=Desulfosporosinus youngiae DSM 17734 TaxID=768710 RepID=H5XZY6_9FIRM|nr:hypothetical protein [Desulfosporosinus youngiae]EHQ92182.1 hypothetical protein DesyoDRAFT_5253 [Desulfosporosinus youngiae DSM 17734]
MGYKNGGWKNKYKIQKCVGERYTCHCAARSVDECHCFPEPVFEDVDPEGIYLVLRLDKDPNARVAALAYADSVEAENKEFAIDVRKKVSEAMAKSKERIGESEANPP